MSVTKILNSTWNPCAAVMPSSKKTQLFICGGANGLKFREERIQNQRKKSGQGVNFCRQEAESLPPWLGNGHLLSIFTPLPVKNILARTIKKDHRALAKGRGDPF
jgi:hypothetical protein